MRNKLILELQTTFDYYVFTNFQDGTDTAVDGYECSGEDVLLLFRSAFQCGVLPMLSPGLLC